MIIKTFACNDMLTVEHDSRITHNFKIMDYVPNGYTIWNVDMPDGFLLLCKLSAYQPFKGGQNIDAESLVAIKFSKAHILSRVSRLYGIGSLSEAERYIKRYQDSKKNSYAYKKSQKIQKALPLFNQIKWA